MKLTTMCRLVRGARDCSQNYTLFHGYPVPRAQIRKIQPDLAFCDPANRVLHFKCNIALRGATTTRHSAPSILGPYERLAHVDADLVAGLPRAVDVVDLHRAVFVDEKKLRAYVGGMFSRREQAFKLERDYCPLLAAFWSQPYASLFGWYVVFDEHGQ